MEDTSSAILAGSISIVLKLFGSSLVTSFASKMSSPCLQGCGPMFTDSKSAFNTLAIDSVRSLHDGLVHAVSMGFTRRLEPPVLINAVSQIYPGYV